MEKKKTSLCFISKGRVVNVPFAPITHISKHGIATMVYTEENFYCTHQSLQQLLHQLPQAEFFRIHRSHIISIQHMRGTYRRKIKVGVHALPVSAYFRQQMLRAITKKLDQHIEFHFPE